MAAIKFRLLGPLEVWLGGRQLAVAGAKPRALLAMLLLDAGEAVSTDRLIDGLWGERPPANAANALQAHVAALRRVLDPGRPTRSGDGLLVTRAPGYLLRIDGEALDIMRFERLTAQGSETLRVDPAAAAALLREGLALWHGRALAEFLFEPFAGAEAARLEELRLAALQARVDADLALGCHGEVVPELEALLAEHPLRERLAGQLMLALYRCGRQADACRVFHATRAVLVQELAMEPQPALRQLLQRVLDQDRSLDWSASDAANSRAGKTTAERPAHNLPAELTSFVGRQRELKEVCSLLHQGRLLTLTGAGGSGKTRLALRAARQVVGEYPDGVWLIELAALADPALVGTSLAAALGVRERSGPPIEALKRRLRDWQVLVVLDNCEHLLDACAELAHELLSSCEGVRILATSRAPLKIAGEVTWQVPGLALPDAAALPSLEETSRYAAIRLFAERAAAVRPEFALDPESAEAVTLVCRRLDGIPLAIELAAARARVLSPEEILRRLDDRFGLLTGGARDAVARQQTLRATIDWSHDLLDRAERALFRRLSVFAGGWTLADAELVCADAELPLGTIFEVLCELVAKSLVVADPAARRATRYRLLEMLRDYASERLTAAGEQESIGRRHFSHFLQVAEVAHKQQLSGASEAGLETLATQQDNIRAALAFAQAADAGGLLRLATATEQLWLAGNLAEGWRWLEEALAQAPEATPARVRALNTAAALTTLLQAWNDARRLVDESLGLASALDDKAGEAWARVRLGFIELANDNPAAAVPHLEQSRVTHQELGDRLGLCRSLLFLGVAMTVIPGSGPQGRIELEGGLRLAQELGDVWGMGFGQSYLGFAELDEGERERAAIRFPLGLRAEALGPIRAAALEGLAELAVEQHPRRSVQLQAAATALRERDGAQPPAWRARRSAAIRVHAEQRLDADVAREAWDAGRRMTTEQAIAYALGQAEPPRPACRQPAPGAPAPSEPGT